MKIKILIVVSNILCSSYCKKRNLMKNRVKNICCLYRKPNSNDINDFKLAADDLNLSEKHKNSQQKAPIYSCKTEDRCSVIYNKNMSSRNFRSKRDRNYHNFETDQSKEMDVIPDISSRPRNICTKSNGKLSSLKKIFFTNSKSRCPKSRRGSSDTQEDELRQRF
ncbi:hypothetical protein CWI36_0092p0040 [Hamiltosporidium magnivora]|uniref:Uncharacterized protein n=1 Tax=Hamiltosporidium magnivora TaxID=148818 RepID=A0A4V2JWQ3_9MICR|nr:hypothetical protein CWI36_0092p0040 [Hamiltosporidium magnivora]